MSRIAVLFTFPITIRTHALYLVSAATLVAGTISSSSVRADSSFSNPYSSVGGTAGLNVDVYHLGTTMSQGSGAPGFANLYSEDAMVSALTPTYTFVNTNINTTDSIADTGGDSTPTDTFFGNDAAGAAATDATPLQTTFVREYGFVDFEAQNTYTFSLNGNDDIAAVYLGGQALPNGGPIGNGTLIDAQNYNGSIGSAPGLPNGLGIDIFTVDNQATTGWYPIEIDYYNQAVASDNGGAGLRLSITGGPMQFATGDITSPAPYYTELNPLHEYSYSNPSNGGVDSAPDQADTGNGTIVGNATVSGGALHTTGTPGAQGMRVGNIGFFGGSFSIEQWFTRADTATNNQTLFAFGNSSNYIQATPAGTAGQLTLTLFNGTTTTLTALAPQAGTLQMLGVTFDATTGTLSLYVNGTLIGSQVAGAFDLASAVSANGGDGGVNGFSPLDDPSLNGATDEFRLYRESLSAGDIEQNYNLGPDGLLVPEPSSAGLLSLAGILSLLVMTWRKIRLLTARTFCLGTDGSRQRSST